MLARLTAYIQQQHLLPTGKQVLLAVSGGRDSVCLAHLLTRCGIPFAIAHCNFHLRPAECDRDEAFVKRLAATLGVPLHLAHFDTRRHAAAHHQSLEEAARELRYNFFARMCRQHGYPCVATAHHRDDSIETLLLNLFRGTGLRGLHGIRPTSTLGDLTVVHPLLCFSRSEIDAYIEEQQLEYVDDHTNFQLEARRNRIRLQLMPLLRRLYPDIDTTLEANIERLHDAEQVYLAHIEQLRHQMVQPRPSVLCWMPPMEAIALSHIAALVPRRTLLYELLRPYGASATQVDEVLASLPNPCGQLFLTPTHKLTLHRDHLLIAAGVDATPPRWEAQPLPAGSALHTDSDTILVDADLVRMPLTMRPWREGDRFHPFGMGGTKRVSELMSDLHLSRLERPWVHLLTDADDRIVWVAGLRADDRFRVGESTRHILKITLQH